MEALNEKETEMGRLQTDLESAQREREEKEQALMEAMANIHVKEHETEENDIGENGQEYSKILVNNSVVQKTGKLLLMTHILVIYICLIKS
jgi:hypothetical protein